MSKIKCLLCNDIIESKYRHDFKWCKCGKVAIDGGNDYLKITYPGTTIDDVEIIERADPSKIIRVKDLPEDQQHEWYSQFVEAMAKNKPNKSLKDLMKKKGD